MALSYYAMKNARIGGHAYVIGDKVDDADLNGKGPLLVKQGLVTADGSSGGGGGGLVHIATHAFSPSWDDPFAHDAVAVFRGLFSATYDNYRLVGRGYDSGDTGSDLNAYMETSDGSALTSNHWSASIYQRVYVTRVRPDEMAQEVKAPGEGWDLGRTSGTFAFEMDLFGPALAAPTHASWSGHGFNTSTPDDFTSLRGYTGYGVCTDPVAHTGIVLQSNTQLSNLGFVSLYGYAKA